MLWGDVGLAVLRKVRKGFFLHQEQLKLSPVMGEMLKAAGSSMGGRYASTACSALTLPGRRAHKVCPKPPAEKG